MMVIGAVLNAAVGLVCLGVRYYPPSSMLAATGMHRPYEGWPYRFESYREYQIT